MRNLSFKALIFSSLFVVGFTLQALQARHSCLIMCSDEINISRMLNTDAVKNVRDISGALDVTDDLSIKPGRLLRTGCVSSCSPLDTELFQRYGVKTLIDLRSMDELSRDDALLSHAMYRDFTVVEVQGRRKPREVVQIEAPGAVGKRHFVSILDESIIRGGLLRRLNAKTKSKVLLFGLAGIFYKRAKVTARTALLEHLNSGGLSLLNEMIIDHSAARLVYILKLLANEESHPVALYCTAGKDRTGLIVMLLFHVLGASDAEIRADYILSDSAYRDIADDDATVMSLKQQDIDSSVFLRAPAHVVTDTLGYLRFKGGGSINAYLDRNGFDVSWRNKLRKAFLKDPRDE